MKKVLKTISIILGGLVGLMLVAALVLAIIGTSKFNKQYPVEAKTLTIPSDDAAVARGEHLVNVFCKDCHTPDLTGQLIFDAGPIGRAYASNLTGIAETHSDEEIARAIRHGLDQEGRPMLVMPADSFIYFSEEDLGAVIAYLKTVSRAGEAHPARVLRPVGRILTGAGVFDSSLPATFIDHDAGFPVMPEVGANVAYGEYLSRFCQGCHGSNLTGGQFPAPGAPPAPNLTPAGALGSWTEAGFISTIRTGVTPHGRELNGEWMPWESLAKLTDDELSALWLYLKTLPPSTTANQ